MHHQAHGYAHHPIEYAHAHAHTHSRHAFENAYENTHTFENAYSFHTHEHAHEDTHSAYADENKHPAPNRADQNANALRRRRLLSRQPNLEKTAGLSSKSCCFLRYNPARNSTEEVKFDIFNGKERMDFS